MYRWIILYKCIHLYNHHPDQGREHLDHSSRLLHLPQSVFLYRGSHCSDLCHWVNYVNPRVFTIRSQVFYWRDIFNLVARASGWKLQKILKSSDIFRLLGIPFTKKKKNVSWVFKYGFKTLLIPTSFFKGKQIFSLLSH